MALRERDRRLSKADTINRQLRKDLYDYEQDIKAALKKHDSALQDLQVLEQRIGEKEVEIELLKEESSSLRSYIANSSFAREPVHQDSYYTDNIDGLNHFIQSAVAKTFKSKPSQDLSEEAGNQILDILSKLGEPGKGTVKVLSKLSIWEMHKHTTRRIMLVRHITALFLWEKVFTPFAFGLEKNLSYNFLAIEDYLSSCGSLNSTTLIVHRF
jgi:hypothetical protein